MSAMNGKAKYYINNEGGSHVAFAGDETQQGKKTVCGRWTLLEIILLILFGVSTLVAVALVIVLATNNAKHSDSRTESSPQPLQHTSTQKIDITLSTKEPILSSTSELCLTEDCVKAAATILEGMNTDIHPCDDFYEYACGKWNKKNVIPDDRSSYNTFAKLRDNLQVTLKDLLERDVTDKDSDSTKNAKYLYHSCINETVIDERGLQPVFTLLEELGGWPVTGKNSSWDEESFDLIDLMLELRLYNNKIIIDQWVSADDKNSEVNIIQLDQPDLGMPSRDYYLKGWEDESVRVYQQFAVDVALVFGANETAAEEEMREMVTFEINLANATIPQDQRRDNEKLYNRMTIKDLQTRVPEFNWLRYIQMMFKQVNITIDESEQIVVYAPEYLERIVQVLKKTSNRTLANYLIWRIMMNRVTNLPEQYRDLRKEYHRTIYGSPTERARWRDCVSYVNDNMGNAVGRMFVEEHFNEEAKQSALDMIHNIREAFNDLLEHVDWMDIRARTVAREKADAIAEKIGYAAYILNNTALDEDYKNIHFHPDRYFENVLDNLKNIALSNLEKLHKPVDRTRWSTTPAVVNAFYSSTKNQIMFPAGILQPPFYSRGHPKSVNYGAIGMVIGHEITHGFDDRGRQFDKDGNLKQWWDNHVIENFKRHAQCFIDQYSNFSMPEVGLNLNGVQTQGENIADNGGLKEAYIAYVKWADEQNREEPRLPGLSQFDHKQLFFLSFAQVWCGTMRPEAAVNRIRTGVHSPGRFRVIGTLQNSKEFAEVFNCPKTSKMNPSSKCGLW